MSWREILSALDDSNLPYVRDAVRDLLHTWSFDDDDVIYIAIAVSAAIMEYRLILAGTIPYKVPLFRVYCSTPDLCISTEEFARQAGLDPKQIRYEYLFTGGFFGLLPVCFDNERLAWPQCFVSDYLEHRNQKIMIYQSGCFLNNS